MKLFLFLLSLNDIIATLLLLPSNSPTWAAVYFGASGLVTIAVVTILVLRKIFNWLVR